MGRVAKMNKKILLLGALALCVTTISLASDRENESDGDWEMWENPQEKEEKNQTLEGLEDTLSNMLKKKQSNLKKRTKKNKDGSVVPKVMFTTIYGDGTENDSAESLLSSKKKGRRNSLDKYLAAIKKEPQLNNDDDGGNGVEAYGPTVGNSETPSSSFSAPCSSEKVEQKSNDSGTRKRLLPLTKTGTPAPQTNLSSHAYTNYSRWETLSWYEIVLSVLCPGYYYEHYSSDDDDDY